MADWSSLLSKLQKEGTNISDAEC